MAQLAGSFLILILTIAAFGAYAWLKEWHDPKPKANQDPPQAPPDER